VIHVVTAVITAEGENMTANTEQTETAQASVAAEPKAKKATAGTRRAPVARQKGKSRKKASPAKKAPKTQKGEKKGNSARDGSKTAKILELLKRPGGASSKELMKTTGWQAHSVRGFLSGTIRKKMGLAVASTRGEDNERRYYVKS
jgi:hypothetical protein